MVEKILTVRNRAGIHARPASLIAQTANKFSSEILLENNDTTVNAKSIMGVITMAAGYNTNLVLKADGSDAADAVAAIAALFENKFEEE
ncbi:MAG: HPr family phosphocarrier protein [Spirochaetaceae bacterium]|jgi:phosphocarrier protein|nr:HPr family phosphocarrier protein [Spirochaetaceae bacterium]MBO5731593.1 HPr family phosphocarrier protein [Treponema sp.]MCI6663528.1 HPr family phosphocarrier protein [Spirochaetia bacterium]MBO7163419.1 HPr family phosphocarrier protein [Spirochaetaceae bacterium]MDD7274410.1 HPr family phosphocarrier protein [Treponema sp.]